MELRQLYSDDSAVSPVIGVILMVAITVILAAVIASFVLGLGPGETAPTANFDFEEEGSGDVTITFSNGDKLDASNIVISGDNDNSGQAWYDYAGTGTSASQIGSGDSVTAEGVTSGETVRVVWETSDTSQTLDEHTVN